MSIEDYEFVDSDTKALKYKDGLTLTYPDYVYHDGECLSVVNVYKKDVIALAKHFKLTEEDLK